MPSADKTWPKYLIVLKKTHIFRSRSRRHCSIAPTPQKLADLIHHSQSQKPKYRPCGKLLLPGFGEYSTSLAEKILEVMKSQMAAYKTKSTLRRYKSGQNFGFFLKRNQQSKCFVQKYHFLTLAKCLIFPHSSLVYTNINCKLSVSSR